MSRRFIFLIHLVLFSALLFSGEISGTVRNMAPFEGNMTIVAMGADMSDLMGAPMEMVPSPEFPYDYVLEDSAIVDFSPVFVAAFMYSGPFPFPSSGNPFGVHPEPVIPIDGGADDIDIVLWEHGNVGGDIDYSGPFERVWIHVYDGYSFRDPVIESTHYIGDDNYSLEYLPAGPKRIQAFDDLNTNGVYDEGEPQGYAVMSVVGFDTPIDLILVTGRNAAEGTDITIEWPERIDQEIHKDAGINAKIYPNPCFGDVNLSYDIGNTNGNVEIYDINGRRIVERVIFNHGTETVHGLEKGTYFYRINTENNQESGKILILD
ncbi:MAG: T9SS type A sorting domain-containing protein [Candidatus Zixiibacteriota bacterium]